MDKIEKTGLGIKHVSIMLGITAHTLRAWEKRYRVVQPKRVGSRRFYSAQDVVKLQQLKQLVGAGVPIRKACKQVAPEKNQSPENPTSKIIALAKKYKLESIAKLLRHFRVRRGTVEFVTEIVAPLLHEVGQQVELKQLNVGQEHALSALVREQLIQIRKGTRNPKLPTLAFATPAEDFHEFGILMASKIADALGFRTLYFGPNLPANALLEMLNACRPDVLVLGTTAVANNLDHFDRYLAEAMPKKLQAKNIWIAGAMAESVRNRYRALFNFSDFRKALDSFL